MKMFKLVVLFAFVAVAAAKPYGAQVAAPFIAHSYVASAPISYVAAAPIVAQTYVVPAAVSSTYREDIISKPASTTYVGATVVAEEKPVVVEAKSAVAEPVTEATTEEIATEAVEIETVKPEPLVTKAVEAPAAVSSTYRQDIISKPAILAYSVPLVQNTISYTAPVAYHALPAYHPW